MNQFIEEKIREFDNQFVPIDWLLFSAKESPGGDRGVDVAVANYHADRIKLWLKNVLTEVATAQRESDVKILEGMKVKTFSELIDQESVVDYHNAALDDAITKIREV